MFRPLRKSARCWDAAIELQLRPRAESASSGEAGRAGNVHLTGSFTLTVDFDPGPGVFNLFTTDADDQDVFVMKLNPDGQLTWAVRFGFGSDGINYYDEQSQGIAVDSAGHVYSTGVFCSPFPTDFDPGTGRAYSTASDCNSIGNFGDIYLQKLDSHGNLLDAKRLNTGSPDRPSDLSVMPGRIHLSGAFINGSTTDILVSQLGETPPRFDRVSKSSFVRSHTVNQHASTVIGFSSQTSTFNWSAAQALGLPNTAYGDNPTAWAPASQNGTLEYLELGFDFHTHSEGVAILETYGNGFVTQVELLDLQGTWHVVWAGIDPGTPGTPYYLLAEWPRTTYLVKGIRIWVDTNHNLNTWEEIDSLIMTSGETFTLARFTRSGGAAAQSNLLLLSAGNPSGPVPVDQSTDVAAVVNAIHSRPLAELPGSWLDRNESLPQTNAHDSVWFLQPQSQPESYRSLVSDLARFFARSELFDDPFIGLFD